MRKKFLKTFFISLITYLICYGVAFLLEYDSIIFYIFGDYHKNRTLGQVLIDFLSRYNEFYIAFFPIIITFVGGSKFYSQYKSKNLKNILYRETKKSYILKNFKDIIVNICSYVIILEVFVVITMIIFAKNFNFEIHESTLKNIEYLNYGSLWKISPILFYLSYVFNLIIWGIALNFIGFFTVIYFKKGFLYYISPIVIFIALSIIFGISVPQIAPQNLLDISLNRFSRGYHSLIEASIFISTFFTLSYNYFVKKEISID